MSSPKEPGQPGQGDNAAGAEGPGDRTGQRAAAPRAATAPPREPSAEVPPWQRGASRTQQSGGNRPAKADAPTREIRVTPPAPAAAEAENSRIARYVTGTAAPAALQAQVEAERAREAAREAERAKEAERARETERVATKEAERTREYASELPDLSGPAPRPPQRREGADRPDSGANTQWSGGSRVQVGPRAKSGPVRASLQIRRIDPWSTLKVSLLLSVALFFVWMIAVAFLYLVLGGMGVWSKLNSNVGDLLTSTSGSGGELVSSGTIFGGALLIGLLNIVILTALATLGAFIYNLTTDIVGGVEVTLADRE